jgi:hypothetical protein
MLRELDKQINLLAESTARKLTRRRALTKGVKSAFAVMAGLAGGVGLAIKEAEAVCTCTWAQGRRCSQTSCPQLGGCPTNYSRCTSADWCSGWCPYPNGYWVSCSGLGAGNGYKLCTDCKANIRQCDYLCTCLSDCIHCDSR